MLDGNSQQADDIADLWTDEQQQPRRHRGFSQLHETPEGPDGMALIRSIDTNPQSEESNPPDEEPDSSDHDAPEAEPDHTSGSGRYWHWYVRPRNADEATHASARPVSWGNHTCDVVQRATEIVDALELPEELKQAVILAAKFHDLGKKRELWQRSIGNPNPTDWHAKPGKPEKGSRWRPRSLSPYRHEFGSLLDLLDTEQEHHRRLEELPEEMRDVVLHLVAAHHGYARPHFPAECTIDPNHHQQFSDEVAIESIRRFARLQRRYGRWGLACLESLLRAADWAASANSTAPSEETP